MLTMNCYCLSGFKRVLLLFALCIAMARVSVFQCFDLYAAFHCIAVTPLHIPELVSQ